MKNILVLGAVAVLSPSAFAFVDILTTEHADLGIAYEGGEWDLHVHDEDGDRELEAADTLMYIGPDGKTSRPAGSDWDFFGNSAGEDLWILPQTQDTNLVFLGIAGEEIDAGVFDGNVVNLFLSAVRGPGEFSLYTTDSFGDPTVFMSSADGIGAGDMVPVPVGGHAHFNWAFTGQGLYEVDMFAQGTISGQTITSDVTTYHFGAEAVPEPATMTLLGLGALAALRRKKK